MNIIIFNNKKKCEEREKELISLLSVPNQSTRWHYRVLVGISCGSMKTIKGFWYFDYLVCFWSILSLSLDFKLFMFTLLKTIASNTITIYYYYQDLKNKDH